MPSFDLHSLGRLSAQLSSHNQRLKKYLEALPRRVDRLVAATMHKDWDEVRRAGDFLACSSVIFSCGAMTQAAERVCLEANKPDNDAAIQRSVVLLVEQCEAMQSLPPPASNSSESAPVHAMESPAG